MSAEPQTPSKNSIRASRSLKPTKLPHCSATRRLDLCTFLSNNATRCHKITETRCAGVTFVSRCQRSPKPQAKIRYVPPGPLNRQNCRIAQRHDVWIYAYSSPTMPHGVTKSQKLAALESLLYRDVSGAPKPQAKIRYVPPGPLNR